MKPRWELEDPLMPMAPRLASEAIKGCEVSLRKHGALLVESGVHRDANVAVHLHSDKGPTNSSKSHVNQDFAIAWIAPSVGNAQSPRFAIAMADGLSSSRGAEWAAPVVCFTALDFLVTQSGSGRKPIELAEMAFRSAGRSLTEMVHSMANDVAHSCPAGEFSRTWQHILSKSLLLQTTLSVVWCDGEFFYSAVVGDGGILLRTTADRSGDREIAKCDLSTSLVHPLRPEMSDRELARQDFTRTAVGKVFEGIMCTDGIARGVDNDLSALLDQLPLSPDAEDENPTSLFIDEAIRTNPQSFDDNLSLAVFHVTLENSKR
jgi:hypothetical protein